MGSLMAVINYTTTESSSPNTLILDTHHSPFLTKYDTAILHVTELLSKANVTDLGSPTLGNARKVIGSFPQEADYTHPEIRQKA